MSTQIKQRWWIWYGISLIVIILDQLSKQWAEAALGAGQSVVITSFFRFELAYNLGAAFSFLGDAGGWQRWFFAVIALAVSVFIVGWIARLARQGDAEKKLELLALCLILGGALGNLYDRVVLGHVIDFIVWHYQDHYWPTFNIADSAICVGAAFLVVDMLFLKGGEIQQGKRKENGASTEKQG